MAESLLGIGPVSALTGLTERQIRYYESQGLITPRRTPGRQRLYGPPEVARLQQIRRMLDAGQTLQTVRRALGQQRTLPPESDVRSRLLSGQALRSLYPVSNRAELERMISEHEEEDDVD
ncbi:MAG: MerR family transcriptional regulator [Thermaerobacter sp.]|nr:MerR family transcriptional regulator [Thermaerobacter sp.]